jgi:hypothetical protein
MSRHPRPARPGGPRAVVTVLLGALLLAGCGGSDDRAESGWSTDAAAPSEPMPAPMPGRSPGMDDGMLGGVGDKDLADGRAVVRTAYLELIVDDGAVTIATIRTRIVAFGGHVATTNLSRAEDGTVSGSLNLRVPAERLDELVDELDALARAVPVRSVDEFDVTLELTDLDAQLANLRAYEVELRALLTEVRERGGDVEGLVAVSDRLRSVRTEIDRITAWRTRLATDVAMSSVTVLVMPARSATPVSSRWDLPGVVRDALAATVGLARLAVEALVWFALTVLPALLVTAAVALGARRTLRRRAARRLARRDLETS